MAKSNKPKAELPGAFRFIGRVVHDRGGVDYSTGATFKTVVLEDAWQSESKIFKVYGDYGDVCGRGEWVTLQYHLDKKDNHIVDAYEPLDTTREIEAGDFWAAQPAALARSHRLLAAAKAGLLDEVERLIGEGANIDLANPLGNTPAICAALSCRSGDHAGCLRALVRAGCDLDRTNVEHQSAAIAAAARGSADCLRAIADGGANLDASDSMGWTPAIHAAREGYEGCLRLLAERGADLGLRDKEGKSAANHAQEAGFESCAEIAKASETARAERAAFADITAGKFAAKAAPRHRAL